MAEIRVGDHGIAIYGQLLSTDDDTLTVNLLTIPRDQGMIRQGDEAEVVYFARGTLFTAVVAIAGWQNNQLVLGIRSEAKPAPHRTRARVRYHMPVQYRAVRPDGRMGAWLECEAEDIGGGGIGLVFEAQTSIPRRMEVRFLLPAISSAKSSTRIHLDSGSVILSHQQDDRPIKAVGRVVHTHPRARGRVHIGLAYSVIAPQERDRIVRFVESLSAKAA